MNIFVFFYFLLFDQILMFRFCCRCCLSRKKHKSFPIHEKQHETEVNKVFIKHVEPIRLTPSPINKKSPSKTIIKKKFDDTKKNCGTKNLSNSRIPASKLFHKSKPLKTPSPLSLTFSDFPETTYNKTRVNTASSYSSSSSSSTTNSDLPKKNKRSQHRSFVESYDISKENSIQKKSNDYQTKKLSNETKSPAKSKLVLENVRKMIKDQNIQQQQQHFNPSKQKESARL